MKFRVFRTSDYDCCYPPCEGAVLINHELKYKSGNYEIYKNKSELHRRSDLHLQRSNLHRRYDL